MTPYQRVASLLQNARRSGIGLTARCPAHEDKCNSLSVNEGSDGRVLVKCFAGCDVSSIATALGLSMTDLFSKQGGEGELIPPDNGATVQQSVNVAQYAAAKELPVEFLQGLGLTDMTYQGRPAVRVPYLDETGAEIAVRIRTALEKSETGDDRFRWRRGSKPRLYGLWRRPKTGDVILCEGESDCHTLWFHGFPALGIPGAASWNEARDAAQLDGAQRIFVIIEPDRGGAAVLGWLGKSKIRHRAFLLTLDEFKDPSALHLDDPARFSARMKEAMAHAVPVPHVLAAQQETQKVDAWNSCKRLAESNSVLSCFADALRGLGVVGEECTAKLLYLALTTRFLDCLVSMAVKGPSSGGKNFITEQVLRFFPESAFYRLTAMSERALAYTEADLSHRFIVVSEAAGLSGDFASYLVRSLLSEGRLIYEVVEKTPTGLKPRRIEKEGPTGLLVTTTAIRLHPENETRLLSLRVADTREQTKAVLLAIAEGAHDRVDLGPWAALQVWLEHAEHRVVVPYARQLAMQVRPVSVRLRRDFKAVLALVMVHALLHQATRPRDEEGRIVATLGDYASVRELVASVVAESAEASVPEVTKETVEAVGRLLHDGDSEVTLTALAEALKLDKSAASRRVADAVSRGHLKNLQERKGRPARLVLGDALPMDTDVLPSIEVLQRCGVEGGEASLRSVGAASELKRIIEVQV